MDRSEVHQFLRINDFGGEPKTGPHYLTIAHTSSAVARPQLFPFKPGFLFVLGDAKPVYFPLTENKWSNDDYGNGSYKSSVFHDKDGSVGGVPNSFIVINGGIAIDEACEIKPTWNAAVCKGDVGRMTVGGGGGPVGF